MILKSLRRVASHVPLVWDLYAYNWAFYHKVSKCRGVFSSFSAAKAAAPSTIRMGYNQPDIGAMENVARQTACREFDQFDPTDQPILNHLQTLLHPKSTVFNLGGNVGTEYYAYRKRLSISPDVRWTVCEISEIAAAGTTFAKSMGATQLNFVSDFQHASGCDILLSCGTLQYIEPSLSEMLQSLQKKPLYVLLNRTAMYDGPSYVTLQNIGFAHAPYKIKNWNEFVGEMNSIGYSLIDAWRDARITKIPFHPSRRVRGYRGGVFRYKAEG